jgi:hypothetical protein
LADLARTILHELQLTDPDRRVKMHIAGPMVVNADEGLMRVALENLLANAWKYSSKRDNAEISFTCRPDDAGGWVFCVRDNGAGFDPGNAHRLFKPFQRLHSDAEFAGVGLGLATVRRVIAKHDGLTWADSKPGAGARFFFTLGAQHCQERELVTEAMA